MDATLDTARRLRDRLRARLLERSGAIDDATASALRSASENAIPPMAG